MSLENSHGCQLLVQLVHSKGVWPEALYSPEDILHLGDEGGWGGRVIKGNREELIMDHKSAASNLLHMLLLQLLPDFDWIILYALYVDALAGREKGQ